ncbi:MAG: hypothetical protein J4A00_06280 [Gammaproteobacteria bacterium]|nr:hypothetical protein [Gammaproteobacteria bacterium]
MSAQLPAGFEALEPFAECWDLDTQAERWAYHLQCSYEELEQFYDAILPLMEALVEHLNKFPLHAMPAPEHRLKNLGLSFMEVAPSIELFGEVDQKDAFDPSRASIVVG